VSDDLEGKQAYASLVNLFKNNLAQLQSFRDKIGITADTPLWQFQRDGQTVFRADDKGRVLEFTVTRDNTTGAVHGQVYDGTGWNKNAGIETSFGESIARTRELQGGRQFDHSFGQRNSESAPYAGETGADPSAKVGWSAEYANSVNQVTQKSVEVAPDGSGHMSEFTTTLGSLKAGGFVGVSAKPGSASIGGSAEIGAVADSAGGKLTAFGPMQYGSGNEVAQDQVAAAVPVGCHRHGGWG